ncbi:nicotinate (nicotinamide) nucleotide adenylyltransferase [candidate division KSB1 bacterium]
MTDMKTGLFGGTFNPIHIAHLVIAEWVRSELDLDRIYFMPTAQSPMKVSDPSTGDMEHRIRMVELAIKGNDKFRLSDYESEPGKVYYSVDTVRRASEDLGLSKDRLFFIIGEDNFEIVPTKWKNPEKLASLCTIVVARRFGNRNKDNTASEFEHIFVDTPVIDISSSMIRERIRSGLSIRYLLPPDVEQYIIDNNLYTENG